MSNSSQLDGTRTTTIFLKTVQRLDIDGQDERLDAELMHSPDFPKVKDDIQVFLLEVLQQVGHLDTRAALRAIKQDEKYWAEVKGLTWDSVVEKQFYTLRRLAKLQPQYWERKFDLGPPRDEKRQAIESAWNIDYLGSAHELLFENIKMMFSRNPEDYKREVSIIQSSGSGKSRMVHELSKLAFTIPLNVRSKEESQAYAYPPPDLHISQLFNSEFGEENLRIRMFLFFTQVFKHVMNALDSAGKTRRSRSGLAAWWSSYLEEERQAMYSEVHSKTLQAIEHCDRNATSECYSEAAVATLTLLCEKLEAIAPLDETAVQPAIIFYVDEAHTMMMPQNQGYPSKSRLDIFRSCAADFKEYMFFIFISTDPKVGDVSPVAVPSARTFGGPRIPAPITETPFDCYFEVPGRVIAPGFLRHEDVSDMSFMAKFGRPLFWTMIEGEKESHEVRETLMLAGAKLVAVWDTDIRSIGNIGRLAVFDVLLSIRYDSTEEAACFLEAEMVRFHLRTAFSIPEHRRFVTSGYASEPFVAEAASRILWDWRRQSNSPMNPANVFLTTLTQNFTILDRKELLELAGRELLTHAYQKSVAKERAGYYKFSDGCLLMEFIENLFTPGYAGLIFASFPDNISSSTIAFREAFKNARLRFTHFAIADQTCVTTNAMWAAYVRGMALTFPNKHRTFDCIIPILLWDAFLCEHVMTGLLVHFKQPATGGDDVTEAAEFFNASGANEVCQHARNASLASEMNFRLRPYVKLNMDLTFKFRPRASSTTPPILRSRAINKESAFKNSQHSTSPVLEPDCHPQYQISAYGCSSTVYSVIDPSQHILYAELLPFDDILGENGRQDAESLSAIRRLKPFFSQGPDSYDWVADADLNTLAMTVRPDEECVVVGVPGKTCGDDEMPL